MLNTDKIIVLGILIHNNMESNSLNVAFNAI